MKTYIIQLENHDDVISARDKLSWSKARRVLLIWPRRGKVLERRVDLLLVQRHCQQLGAQLGIVTASGEVKAHAHELGIPTFSNPLQAQQVNWHRARGVQQSGRASIWQARHPAQALRERGASFRLVPVQNRWLRLGMFAAGVFAFLALALFFVPRATVTLSPIQKSQEITIPVWAQTGIQAVNPSGGMPMHATSIVVEGRDQVAVSGRVSVPDHAAEGEVMFTNLTDQVVEIPLGSVVLSAGDSSQRFLTIRQVQIPAGLGETGTTLVQASLPGSGGNVTAGQVRALEGPNGLMVVVDNLQPFFGGSDRSSPAPTQQDYQKLRSQLLLNLGKIALEEAQGKLEPGQRFLDGSLQPQNVVEENREPAENAPADILQLTMRVEYVAYYIDESDLQAISQAALDANLPDGFQPLQGSLSYTMGQQAKVTDDTAAGDEFRGTLTARRTIKAILSEYEMVEVIRGRSIPEAVNGLQSYAALTTAPVVELVPSWWPRLPFLSFRISLVEQ
jgi:hypothetical protein